MPFIATSIPKRNFFFLVTVNPAELRSSSRLSSVNFWTWASFQTLPFPFVQKCQMTLKSRDYSFGTSTRILPRSSRHLFSSISASLGSWRCSRTSMALINPKLLSSKGSS